MLLGLGWIDCDFCDDYIILVFGIDRMGDCFGYFGVWFVESNMVNVVLFCYIGYFGDRDGV